MTDGLPGRVRRRAQKQLTRIREDYRDRIITAVYALSGDLRPRNSRKLRDREGYRLRIGDYRVLYVVNVDRRQVLVAEVWHRQRGHR
jgi:mRNA interferase RelE/StbE